MRTNTITSEAINSAADAARAGKTRRLQAIAAGCSQRTLTYWLAKGRALAAARTRKPADLRYIQLWQAVDGAGRAYIEERRERARSAWQQEERRREQSHIRALQNRRERKRQYWRRFKERVDTHRAEYRPLGCRCRWCRATW